VRKKKIKTFSVDEEIYNSLVSMFKECETEVSVSYYVDRCLKDLLKALKIIDGLRKQNTEKYTVPMSYVVELMVKAPKIKLMERIDETGEQNILGEDELEEIQVTYEAEQKSIPLRFWRFLRTGKYRLSSGKKHLIENKTGHAYSVDEPFEIRDAPEYDELPEKVKE